MSIFKPELPNIDRIYKQPSTKSLSSSCHSCHRLAEIEGETVCFRQGKIFKLIQQPESARGLNLLCEGWQGKNSLQK